MYIPGKDTTEWKALIISLVTSILAILVALGVVTQEHMDLIVKIVAAIIPFFISAATNSVVKTYITNRTAYKVNLTNNNAGKD